MGAIVAAFVTGGFVFFATVLSLAAYSSGVNVFAWSQQRAMRELGYTWVTPQPRYTKRPHELVDHAVARCADCGKWYAYAWDDSDWDKEGYELLTARRYESDIGFDTPMAAHVYAEVQGWRAS